MPNAPRILIPLLAAAALVACSSGEDAAEEQNITIDSGPVPANADIEALPADESSATPSDELANGSAEPGVNDLNEASNSY